MYVCQDRERDSVVQSYEFEAERESNTKKKKKGKEEVTTTTIATIDRVSTLTLAEWGGRRVE